MPRVEIPEIHVVTPDLFRHPGGIARITRATCAATVTHADRHGRRVVVHALRDRTEDVDPRYLPRPHRFHGYDGDRLALAAALARAVAARSTSGVIASHVNLAPVALRLVGPRPPLVVVAHGIDVWDPLPAHRRHALTRADRVWSVSRFTARVVRALHGVSASAVVAIPNCLDPGWTELGPPTAPLPAGVRPPFLLLVSRLGVDVEDKGVAHTIAAFARARDAGPLRDWQLVIAGDGERREGFARLAARSAPAGSIVLTGRVEDEQLRSLYARCEVFVLPSAKEGFGLVFLEAMHFSRPVIAACASASPEVVADERTGLLVPFADVDAIAIAMRRLARSPELRASLGRAGHEAVSGPFSYAAYARSVGDELERLGA